MGHQAGEYHYNFGRIKPIHAACGDGPPGEYRMINRTGKRCWILTRWARPKVKTVFHGSQSLAPGIPLRLLELSPDGGDATEIREFDLVTKQFVKDGFALPVAKSQASWIDKDTLFVATDFGAGSMTQSGYARIAKRWWRGTPLSAAQTLYEAQPQDMVVYAYHDHTPGFERNPMRPQPGFLSSRNLSADRTRSEIKIDIPADAEFSSTHREWLLACPSSDWQEGETRYPSGALLATHFDDYLPVCEFTVLFTLTAQVALWLQRHARSPDPQHHGQRGKPVGSSDAAREWLAAQAAGQTSNQRTSPFGGIDEDINDYFLTLSGFLQPTSLYMGNLDGGEPELLKQGPQDFDASGYQVSQHFATSKDGDRKRLQHRPRLSQLTATLRRCNAGLRRRSRRVTWEPRRRPGWSVAGVRRGQYSRRW